MPGIPLEQIVRDALSVATVKVEDEPIDARDWRTAIRHLNHLLDNWSSTQSLISGFSRKSFPIPPRNSGVFKIGTGPGADLDVGGRIVDVLSIAFGYEFGIRPHIEQVPAFYTVPGTNRHGWLYNNEQYSLNYGPEFVEVIFADAVYASGARELVIDYKLEFGKVPVPPPREADPDGSELAAILATSMTFPVGYEDALVYGVALRLFNAYGKSASPERPSVENHYNMAVSRLRSRFMQLVPVKLDGGLAPGARWRHSRGTGERRDTTDFSQPGHIDSTAHDLHTTDGTATWGYERANLRHQEGEARFNYGHAFDIAYAAGQGGDSLYFTIPDAAVAVSLVDATGFHQLRGWEPFTRETGGSAPVRVYRLRGLSALAAGLPRQYALTLTRA